MFVDDLPVPLLLLEALDSGRWPRTTDEAIKQNLRSLVPEKRIRRLAPDESKIYLYPPPFATIARHLAGQGADFYRKFGMVDQLVPEAAFEIGDFGLGSDAPILLDYRESSTDPKIIRLCWPGNGMPNVWKVMAPDFPTFMKELGL